METSQYESFDDLAQTSDLTQRIYHDFFVVLLDQLFSQHDNIRIDLSSETERNHEIINKNWRQIRDYYRVPYCVKYNLKAVRQIIIHIVDNLNTTYHLKKPIQLIHRRRGFRDESGRSTAEQWIEFKLS